MTDRNDSATVLLKKWQSAVQREQLLLGRFLCPGLYSGPATSDLLESCMNFRERSIVQLYSWASQADDHRREHQQEPPQKKHRIAEPDGPPSVVRAATVTSETLVATGRSEVELNSAPSQRDLHSPRSIAQAEESRVDVGWTALLDRARLSPSSDATIKVLQDVRIASSIDSLKWDALDDDMFLQWFSVIDEDNGLPVRVGRLLAERVFLPRIQALKSPASRILFSTFQKLLNRYSASIFEACVGPLVRVRSSPFGHELLLRVLKEGSTHMSSEMLSCLVSTVLQNLPEVASDSLCPLLALVLSLGVAPTPSQLTHSVQWFLEQSASQTKNAKFGNALLQLLERHRKAIALDQWNMLRSCVELHQSILKKALLRAMGSP